MRSYAHSIAHLIRKRQYLTTEAWYCRLFGKNNTFRESKTDRILLRFLSSCQIRGRLDHPFQDPVDRGDRNAVICNRDILRIRFDYPRHELFSVNMHPPQWRMSAYSFRLEGKSRPVEISTVRPLPTFRAATSAAFSLPISPAGAHGYRPPR